MREAIRRRWKIGVLIVLAIVAYNGILLYFWWDEYASLWAISGDLFLSLKQALTK